MLTVLARSSFKQIRMAPIHDPKEAAAEETGFGGGLAEITAAEVKGYLKAMHAILSQPAPPTPPHQEPAIEGIRGLVLLNRELAKGAGAFPLIAKNAELLKTESIASINQTLAILDGAKPREPLYPIHGAGEAPSDTLDKEASSETVPAREAADTMEAIPSVEPASPAPFRPERLPSAGELDGPSCEVATRVQTRNEHGEAAPSDQQNLAFGFAVPASSTPAGPGSEIRIYRDENGKIIPAHRLDRRTVARKSSGLPSLG